MEKFNKRYITTDPKYKQRFILTDEGYKYFWKYFPITKSETIANEFGCSSRTIVAFAHKLGLRKNAEYISQSNRRAAQSLTERNFKSFREGCRKFQQTERYKQVMRQVIEKRKRTRSLEYIRHLNGEEQKTKIHFREPYSRKRKMYRQSLKKRHYIPETAKATLVFYYTDDTRRNSVVETNARKVGFTFHPFR